MNIDGLWTMLVKVNGRATSLVATINDGKLTGGNSGYYYTGTVNVEGDTMSGQITGQHYFDQPDPLIGGMKTIPLQINAKLTGNGMQGTAKIQGVPMQFGFTGQKRA